MRDVELKHQLATIEALLVVLIYQNLPKPAAKELEAIRYVLESPQLPIPLERAKAILEALQAPFYKS